MGGAGSGEAHHVVLRGTNSARGVPAALAFATGDSRVQDPSGSIPASAVVVTVPVSSIVRIFRRRIVAGLTAGAVKG